ncbi:MAG TPA: universal stress protein [Acidimicrobiales bacterium]|nr:universal stress protein [Acidimicrobiales bacterium]
MGTIVVGVDGSSSSMDALEWAASQAESTKSALRIVSTWRWPTSMGWPIPVPNAYDPQPEIEQSLEEIARKVRQAHPGVEVACAVVEGHPAQVLVHESENAALLVVGSRGHGEFVGMLIGSVSEYCAAHAHCPVLVHR